MGTSFECDLRAGNLGGDMKRLVLAVAVALLAAGCGSSGRSSTTSAKDSESASSADPLATSSCASAGASVVSIEGAHFIRVVARPDTTAQSLIALAKGYGPRDRPTIEHELALGISGIGLIDCDSKSFQLLIKDSLTGAQLDAIRADVLSHPEVATVQGI